jgi:hypothetical protein
MVEGGGDSVLMNISFAPLLSLGKIFFKMGVENSDDFPFVPGK